MTEAEARDLVASFRETASRLSDDDPKTRAGVYEDLGIRLEYDPAAGEAAAAMAPIGVGYDCVGGACVTSFPRLEAVRRIA